MDELKYEIYIAGSLEEVWGALTAPHQVAKIYYGSVIHSTFKEGDPLEYIGPGKDGDQTLHVYGTLLEFSPNRAFRYTHKVGPSYLENPNADSPESRISWLLETVGGSTKLTLIHDEWKPGDPSYNGSKSAWPMIISNIKTLVETGRTLDFS
ncbi:SRPBCC domain-containing protein [Paenibacillus tuaregi]|uniref:SRPBCC domain-containing protein n=1 Tax=Paenibacillus tuaregi TaxID=1816681 RepID=UPI0008384015|nr:SRPBCC domain-containing protein [Paenibacillus tuaregi]